TNQYGEFRMENVTEGHYAMSAVRIDEKGAYAGASGGGHLANANSIALPMAPEECSVRLTVSRVPTYTVRGKMTPPPSGAFRAKMILKRGDTYPFEMSVPIGSDGQYEFKAIPSGRYQFFAGNLGSGFEVERDIENFDVNIDWEVTGRAGFGAAMPVDFNEAMA